MIYDQWLRKVELFLTKGTAGIDLSAFRIVFHIKNADVESPNTAVIRVYNLAQATIQRIRGEFSDVTLNAGYLNGNFGAVFKGTIKQLRIGRESPTDTYLDIFAADGDIGYNQGVVNTSLAAGTTTQQAVAEVVKAMPSSTGEANGTMADTGVIFEKQNIPSIRGQVLFGMARARLRNYASTLDSSWSYQNGQVVMIPRTGYLSGEVVKINVATGLVGMPQQTDQGISLTCLLNSRLRIGGLVLLNNDEIIKLMQADPDAAPIPYNQWAGFQYNAPLSKDGTYRAFVVEHEGDSRGGPWYSHLVGLAVDVSQPQDKATQAP